MPNEKIVDLPEDTTPAATDFVTTVDVSDTTDSPEGSSKKVQIGNLGTASVPDGSITNAKLADMAQATIKGRAAGAGTGDPTDLTATQATAILNAVVGDSGAGGTKGLVPAPAAGDAAAGRFLDAAGAFSVPPGTGLTTEQVQDVVGAMLTDNNDLDWTYDDGAGTEVATIKSGASSLSPATVPLTDGATITWSTAGARQNNAHVTLGGNRTLDITGEVDGATGLLIVKQDATGGRSLILPGSSLVINDGGGVVALSTGANEIDVLTWYYDGTNFFWTMGVNYS
jgi:hypothetical protein